MTIHLTISQAISIAAGLLSVLLAAVLGGVRFRQLPPNLRYLAGLAWFELPLEVAGEILGLLHHNNLFIIPPIPSASLEAV